MYTTFITTHTRLLEIIIFTCVLGLISGVGNISILYMYVYMVVEVDDYHIHVQMASSDQQAQYSM